MTLPIAPARPLPPSPPGKMDWGANALAAPTTPGRRMPVVDKSKVDPKMLQAAEGMEAMFLDFMMKVMRQTVPTNDMDLDSPATKIYQSMLDSEYSQKAAHAGGIGLADQIIAYLDSQRYTLPRGRVAPGAGQGVVPRSDPTGDARLTGGTHEGQPDNQ
ncbi:MAG TPA: rod-binding protein [Bdellovibrionota bacterium]|nr:rod-binding protein [Bdellovibrionota bacterium]